MLYYHITVRLLLESLSVLMAKITWNNNFHLFNYAY